jgi:GNAT superfamily N-acetyltransferase
VDIRQATPDDVNTVANILGEAAAWLTQTGIPLWQVGELDRQAIDSDIAAGLYFIAVQSNESAGVLRFQLEDPLFWPDMPPGEAAYIHRLAVCRKFSGGEISTALLNWAAERTRTLNRRWLRLDCEASRPKLRAVYERFGFRHHSDRQVGRYYVARYKYAVR